MTSYSRYRGAMSLDSFSPRLPLIPNQPLGAKWSLPAATFLPTPRLIGSRQDFGPDGEPVAEGVNVGNFSDYQYFQGGQQAAVDFTFDGHSDNRLAGDWLDPRVHGQEDLSLEVIADVYPLTNRCGVPVPLQLEWRSPDGRKRSKPWTVLVNSRTVHRLTAPLVTEVFDGERSLGDIKVLKGLRKDNRLTLRVTCDSPNVFVGFGSRSVNLLPSNSSNEEVLVEARSLTVATSKALLDEVTRRKNRCQDFGESECGYLMLRMDNHADGLVFSTFTKLCQRLEWLVYAPRRPGLFIECKLLAEAKRLQFQIDATADDLVGNEQIRANFLAIEEYLKKVDPHVSETYLYPSRMEFFQSLILGRPWTQTPEVTAPPSCYRRLPGRWKSQKKGESLTFGWEWSPKFDELAGRRSLARWNSGVGGDYLSRCEFENYQVVTKQYFERFQELPATDIELLHGQVIHGLIFNLSREFEDDERRCFWITEGFRVLLQQLLSHPKSSWRREYLARFFYIKLGVAERFTTNRMLLQNNHDLMVGIDAYLRAGNLLQDSAAVAELDWWTIYLLHCRFLELPAQSQEEKVIRFLGQVASVKCLFFHANERMLAGEIEEAGKMRQKALEVLERVADEHRQQWREELPMIVPESMRENRKTLTMETLAGYWRTRVSVEPDSTFYQRQRESFANAEKLIQHGEITKAISELQNSDKELVQHLHDFPLEAEHLRQLMLYSCRSRFLIQNEPDGQQLDLQILELLKNVDTSDGYNLF